MTWLLDGNVLTALVLEGHVHHARVKQWMAARNGADDSFATCAITQGAKLLTLDEGLVAVQGDVAILLPE
jgi:predicted nucleic acid-binding protein